MGGFSRVSCFLCLGPRKKEVPPPPRAEPRRAAAARTFALDELAAATRNFRDDSRIVGREANLYKAYLKSINQIVSIKLQHAVRTSGPSEQLNREFLAHVLTLSALRHPNVVNLIGFCADGQYRILVHEHVPLGSLEDHLHPRDRSPAGKAPLDWNTRMNIAARVAKGLEYPSMDLQEALRVASMCVHQQPAMRSPIGTVVTALSRLAYDVDSPESSHPAAPS